MNTPLTADENTHLQHIYSWPEIQAYMASDEEDKPSSPMGQPTPKLGVAQPLLAHHLPLLKLYTMEKLRVVLSHHPEDQGLYHKAFQLHKEVKKISL
jgi:hypothetical protein